MHTFGSRHPGRATAVLRPSLTGAAARDSTPCVPRPIRSARARASRAHPRRACGSTIRSNNWQRTRAAWAGHRRRLPARWRQPVAAVGVPHCRSLSAAATKVAARHCAAPPNTHVKVARCSGFACPTPLPLRARRKTGRLQRRSSMHASGCSRQKARARSGVRAPQGYRRIQH